MKLIIRNSILNIKGIEGYREFHLSYLYKSSYRFTAKELDSKTGNYYYGASSRPDLVFWNQKALAGPSPALREVKDMRGYYNPKISVWLSVDPDGRQIIDFYNLKGEKIGTDGNQNDNRSFVVPDR